MESVPHSGGSVRVLIADDEPVVAQTLARILDHNGFCATFVYDGPSAIRAVESLQPDIFLADVVMPDLDGFETAIHVCNLLPNCIVFLWSAQHQGALNVRELRARGYHFRFIPKPIHPDDLIRRLRNAVQERASQ